MSGGFRPLVNPAAKALGLDPETDVVANTFLFPAAAAATAAVATTVDTAAVDTADDASAAGFATVRLAPPLRAPLRAPCPH